MRTIALFGMGEMGSAIAGRLIEHGARVSTSVEGRSAASVARAEAVGAEIVTDREAVDQAEIVLSIVPPSVAAEVARQVLPLIQRSQRSPTFIDCNAIAPLTLLALSQPFLDHGLGFGDASIIGTSPKPGGPSPRLYMSGPLEAEAELLGSLGLDTRLLSPSLGDASALKMGFAGFTKGFQAIGTAMALGAARNGVAESLLTELRESQPALYGWLAQLLPRMYSKAYRWDDEMREIARFLEPERGSIEMFNGAANLYRAVAADYRKGAQAELIAILDRFAKPGS